MTFWIQKMYWKISFFSQVFSVFIWRVTFWSWHKVGLLCSVRPRSSIPSAGLFTPYSVHHKKLYRKLPIRDENKKLKKKKRSTHSRRISQHAFYVTDFFIQKEEKRKCRKKIFLFINIYSYFVSKSVDS